MKDYISIVISDSEHADIPDVNRKAAQKNAREIARLLGGKVVANPNILAVNEPLRPFVIPLRVEQFKATVYVSDTDYSCELKYRKGEAALLEEALFCVSFKTQDRIMFTKDRAAAVSKALGVDVYRQGFVRDKVVARYLLSDAVRHCLAKVDFEAVSKLFLSPIQLEAAAKFETASICAEQVRVLIELAKVLATARKPEKPEGQRAK